MEKLGNVQISYFNQTMYDFINELSNVTNNVDNPLPVIDLEDSTYCIKFMNEIKNKIKQLANREIEFLEKFDSKVLMFEESTYLNILIDNLLKKNDERVLNPIWRFFETLSLISLTYIFQTDSLKNVFDLNGLWDGDYEVKFINFKEENELRNIRVFLQEEKIDFKLIYNNLKKNTKVEKEKEVSEETNDKESHTESVSPEKMYDDFFGDTKIGSLAQDIAKEIDLNELMGKTTKHMEDSGTDTLPNFNVFCDLMKDGGVMNIVDNVASKLKNKMEEGSVTQEDLLGEVSGLMNKMNSQKEFKDIFNGDVSSAMGDMFKSSGVEVENMEDMLKNLGGMMGGEGLGDLGKLAGNLGNLGNLGDLGKLAGNLGNLGNLGDLGKLAGNLGNLGNLGDLGKLAGNLGGENDEDFGTLEDMFGTQGDEKSPIGNMNGISEQNKTKKRHGNKESCVRDRLRRKLEEKNK
jgi:hypothetical protein